MVRVLHIGDLGLKSYGARPNTFERKVFYGLLRNEYCSYEFSDRDVAKFEAFLNISRLGTRAVNGRLLETADNFRPDLVILSNARSIPNATILTMKQRWPALRVACYTCDPLFDGGNRAHQAERLKVCDRLFVTMGGPLLHEVAEAGPARVHYIPNPTDPSVEYLDNFARDDLDCDLLFCGTGDPDQPRTRLIAALKGRLGTDVDFRVYGMLGQPKITGYPYLDILSRTRMALNINKREEPLYSSDRLSQLMPNGILCFLHEDSGLQVFFDDGQAIFFSGLDDLVDKINYLAANDKDRKRIARAGAEFYRRHFSAELIARFIVETTMETGLSRDYVWPVQSF